MTDLAFLGTGVMGLPMARRLGDGGFVVHAYNRTIAKARPLERDGVAVYDDPRAAAEGCEIVVTMLADADAVLEVADAALGAADATGAERLWIQMSTIGGPGTERCAALAEEREVMFVDAPVLGTRAPAEQGQLVVLASGPESARPAVDPVFGAVGARTLWLGEAGAGSTAKIVLNSWVLGILGAVSDTIALARATDVDPQIFFDAIKGGALDLPYAHMKGAQMVSESFDDVSFALALAGKDVGLVLDAATRAGVGLPSFEGMRERVDRAVADGHGEEDMAAMYLGGGPPSSSATP